MDDLLKAKFNLLSQLRLKDMATITDAEVKMLQLLEGDYDIIKYKLLNDFK